MLQSTDSSFLNLFSTAYKQIDSSQAEVMDRGDRWGNSEVAQFEPNWWCVAGIIIVIKMIAVRIGLDSNMRPEIPCHVYDAYLFSSYKELQNYIVAF